MDRKPTSIDVAASAGVSQATVSRVLNGSALVKPKVRDRVLEAARLLNYRVDSFASKLRSKKVRNLEVVVVKDIGNEYGLINPFFIPMIGEIVRYAGEKGYEVAISFQEDITDQHPYNYSARSAEGMIFLAPKAFETYTRTFRRHDGTSDHWVIWGRERADGVVSCVVSDNETGARNAVTHLARQGRRRIAYLGKFSGEQWEFTERHAGYRQALAAVGLAADPRLEVDCDLTLEGGAAAIQKLIAQRVAFDAVFAATDVLGIGAMRELARRRIDVPQDVAVVGFDDLWICNTVSPRLSSVRQDTVAAARVLVDCIENLVEGGSPSTTRIATELVIRESCGTLETQGRA